MHKRTIIADHVVARGEATGHAHRIEAGHVYEEDSAIHVTASEGTTLVHEEHRPLPLQVGDWTTGIKQEYDHFAEEARRIAD